jgi:hypothetical protein
VWHARWHTSNAHVVTIVAPAAERQNKTPIYVSGFEDTRDFLSRMRTCCLSGLIAQIKREKLMLDPLTAEGFKATVSALRSPNVGGDVTFHTFALPEDRCVRLLIRKLGRRMPEGIVKEELVNLGIRVQAVLQLRSGRRVQETYNVYPLNSHFIVSVGRGPDMARLRSLTELCGLRVSVATYIAPKGPLQCKFCQSFGHTQRYCGYAPRCVACGVAHLSGECSTSKQLLMCCSCGGNHNANYRGCVKWKEAKTAFAKRSPAVRNKQGSTPSPAAAKAKCAEPTAE